MSFFDPLTTLPPDPIFGLFATFREDPRPNKINLGIGTYKNDEGNPFVMPVVRKAEQILLDDHLNKEYLPLGGDPLFLKVGLELLLGNLNHERAMAFQTVGGTAALRMGSELLKELNRGPVYVSEPTWENHFAIFSRAGFKVKTYSYYRENTFCFEAMCTSLNQIEKGGIVLLQGCCHNPTGFDPTLEQWKELSAILHKNQLIPFFDVAYQGLGSGLDEDAASVRQFVEDGHEMLVAYSFSKNFGLYGERAGFLAVIGNNRGGTEKALNHLKSHARSTYSTSPLQGARIVKTILQDATLRANWTNELAEMRIRLGAMRKELQEGLQWSFLTKQKGLFSYTALSEDQIVQLREEYAVYLLKSGRINIAGLNSHNIRTVLTAIKQVTS